MEDQHLFKIIIYLFGNEIVDFGQESFETFGKFRRIRRYDWMK